MDVFIDYIRSDIDSVFPWSLQLKVVQQEKLSDFDAYRLDVECMELAILLEIKLIDLYVLDTGEIYSIDVDTFKEFAEFRSIGNELMYYCPLSYWTRIQ